jgi:hypothetical protein
MTFDRNMRVTPRAVGNTLPRRDLDVKKFPRHSAIAADYFRERVLGTA